MLFTQLFIFIRSTKESRSSCPIKSKMSLNFTYVTVSLLFYQPLSIFPSGIHGPPDQLDWQLARVYALTVRLKRFLEWHPH